jgi:2-polyprenyl-3-methyl-5-hydroxy-6-metoxy-1,4-benzoquinol methylase
MDKFKKIIYDNYVSNHNKNLYGEKSIAKIVAYFPACQHYYGRHLPTDKNAAILDIGCGDGGFVYWLHHLEYANAGGIDISQEQIEQGQRLGIKNLRQADLIQFLINNTKQYDFIIARDVIEHFTRDEVFEILALVNKNLKAGGRFVMQVPNGQGLYYTSIFYGDYTHEMAYTTSSVNQVILNTGFRKSACYPTGPVPTGLVATIRLLLWRLKVAQLKFWKMVETGNPKGIFTQNIIAVIDK